LRFVDVWDAVDHLVAVMDGAEWDTPGFRQRAAVT
jgi:kynureninase